MRDGWGCFTQGPQVLRSLSRANRRTDSVRQEIQFVGRENLWGLFWAFVWEIRFIQKKQPRFNQNERVLYCANLPGSRVPFQTKRLFFHPQRALAAFVFKEASLDGQ
jgi:hypothetical protein